MKNKFFKFSILFLACGLLAAIIEVLCFNFNILTLDNQDASSQITFDTDTTKESKIINIELDDHYVNKLVINYDTSERTPFTLSYTTPDSYPQTSEQTNEDIFDNLLSTSVTNLRTRISTITIKYDKSSQVQINSISIDNDFYFNWTRFFFVFLALLLLCSLIFFYKAGFKTEKLHIYFAVVCSLLGTMIIVAQPAAVFYSFDDQIHFQRTQGIFTDNTYTMGEYQMTRGDPAESVGGEAINSIEEQIAQNNFNDSNDVIPYYNNRTMPTYDKIAYLPMAVGYSLAKAIHLPFEAYFKIGKIFNLIFYVILMAFAIKRAKVGKRLLVVLALIPTNVFLASQYSYDPAVFAGLTIFSVELINLYVDKSTKFNFKTALIIIGSISLACFTKAIYAPLLLLALFIPRQRFTSKKQAYSIKTGLIGITILLASTFILPTLSGTMVSDERGGDTSVNDQLSLIISHPSDYAQVLGDNTVNQFFYKLLGADSLYNFAYIESPIVNDYSNLYFILLIVILFIFFTDNSGNLLNKKQRYLVLGFSLATIIFIWTALYLSYTPVGSTIINGVQGRYFLPLLFLFAIALQPHNIQNKIQPKTYNAIALIIPTIAMLITVYAAILIPYAC